MQSVEQQKTGARHDDFHVLLLDELQPPPREWWPAGLGTALVHLLLLLILISVPKDETEPVPERPVKPRVTPLFDPLTRLTQKARNTAPVSPEISVAPQRESLRPPLPARKVFQAPPTRQQARRAPPLAAPQEPPRIKAAPTQSVQIAPPPVVPPPAAQRSEPPKIALENIPAAPQLGHGTGLLKVPSGGVDEAVKELSRSKAAPTRFVGDDTTEEPPGSVAARPKASLELMSDPEGIDMKPYLLQVLQNVRRNWLSIYPEGARLGLRGRVVVQFAIAPDGKITKTVYITQARANALNEASIAALTMSDPLPQLPAGFKGSRVVLQFTFLYNAPSGGLLH